MFDAVNFMSTVYNETNDTKRINCPAGEYMAQITKVEPRSGIIGKGERTGETWAGLALTCDIQDEGVKAFCQRDKVIVTANLMLDLTAQGGLDMGKQRNITLGQWREATGLNRPGQPFSPMMFTGQMVKIMVKHVPGFKNPEELVPEISGVVKAF